MSLPNYLAKIKSSGIYRFVWDKSEIAGVDAEILRLVVGYSEKGPFNTPVYITRDTEFKAIFGDISKKLEKRGIWFHRLALQALSKGPIIALNLKKFEGETLKACSFDVIDSVTLSTKDIPVESIYDTSRFWKLDPEAIMPATGVHKYISLSSADSKETSCSVFIRGYKPTGYDVTVKEWFSSKGEEVPDYFAYTDDEGVTHDFSALLVSDFFAEIYVFRGEFTPALCASAPLNKYFDVIGGKPQLKEYVENAFGDKIDTLSSLAADEASNFVNSYSGCLLPFFKNGNGAYISLDLLFNADNSTHKMMMNLNSDLLYNGDIHPDQITTTGWLTTDRQTALGNVLKRTEQIYSGTGFEVVDGTRHYDFAYTAEEGKEATAHDYDFIKYVGSTGDEDTLVKYLSGYEYAFAASAEISLYGAGTTKVSALKYSATDSAKTYAGNSDVYVYESVTYAGNESDGYEALPLGLVDLETVSVVYEPTKYSFTSYIGSVIDEEHKWGTGEVTVVERGEDRTSVRVDSNEPEDPDHPFIGATVYIHEGQPTADGAYELFNEADETLGIFVTVEPLDGTADYVYEGKDGAFKAYHKVDGDPDHADDIYLKDGVSAVYVKEEGEYVVEEGFTASKPVDHSDVNGFDFLSAGFELGDRIKHDGGLFTISALDKDFIKASNEVGEEITLSRKDTIEKCNHSCTISSYGLKPVYFEGYTYLHSAPASTTDWDKLQWQKFILSALIDYQGMRTGLTSRKDIDYRYIVDTFEAYVDEEVHKELSLIAKEKDNAVAFLNFPAVKTFKNCVYSSFTDEKGRFQVKYIAEGANKKKQPAVLFSLASEINGGSFASYNTPLLFSDGTVKNYVPAAALVSNNFMDKYAGRQPYYVVAGPRYGRLIYPGLLGPDFNYVQADLDILEPLGVNVTVFVPRLGTYINSNQTAKQTPVTALSKLNIRELVIYLQDEIEKLLQDYQWEFNTPYLRDLIKAKADKICENVQQNGGLETFLNVCDESNNTDDVRDNEMFVLSTSIEPGRACGKMIQELTIYRSGALKSLIK